LRKAYKEAVRHYDESLKLIPGIVDAADTIGQSAAWNRAIALTRIEEEKKKDAGSDGGDNDKDGGNRGDSGSPQQDGSNPPDPDGGKPDPQKDGSAPKQQPEAGPEPDAGNNSKNQDPPDAGPPPAQPPPSVNQDERMLDMLESAPTFQQQDAKNRVPGRKFRGSADK